MRTAALVLLLAVAAGAQEPPTAQDIRDLTAAIREQNALTAQILHPPPPAHPRLALGMKLLDGAGKVALVALPMIVKGNQTTVNTTTAKPAAIKTK